MLEKVGVPISISEEPDNRDYFLTLAVDRANYRPCIITSFSIGGESPQIHAKTYPLQIDGVEDDSTISSIATDLKCGEDALDSLSFLLFSLIDIFFGKEALSLSVRIWRTQDEELSVARAEFEFDDAAFRSSGRNADLQELRDTTREVPEEIEAKKDGIVYIQYDGPI